VKESSEQSPALAVLVTVAVLGIVIVILSWPAPRLCYEKLTGTPALADVCNPVTWIQRAVARVLGG
jgi:hypothetical protein